jgi:aspartate/methionine/tyrosine aminotransferase
MAILLDQSTYTPTLADRVAALGTEGAFEILARAHAIEAGGREVIHLEIGEPSFATPDHIVAAAVASLEKKETRYSPPQGLPELRQAIAECLETCRVPRAPDDIVITPGSKAALFYSVLATVNPGDEVLVPDPGFPIYPSVVRFAGGTAVSYDDFADIAARVTSRTRVVIINSPSNPTGAVADVETLQDIADVAIANNLTVISDEIYSRLTYGGTTTSPTIAPSIAALPEMADRTIVIDGFSKSWSMTGWRLGFAACRPNLANKLTQLAINSHTCVPTFTQRAGLAALTGPQDHIAFARGELRWRRDLVVAGLRDLCDIACVPPEGAFYVFAPIGGGAGSDIEFAERLLMQQGVALLPGSGFGARGAGHVRISFAAPFEKIAVALDRISRFSEGLHHGRI